MSFPEWADTQGLRQGTGEYLLALAAWDRAQAEMTVDILGEQEKVSRLTRETEQKRLKTILM